MATSTIARGTRGDPIPIEERLMARVRFIGAGLDDCWEWRGAVQPSGHGVINLGREAGTDRTHRVAWRIANGPIPDGLCVCHRCDNPPCVNPAHLFLGTQADNMRDMWAKGRGRATGSRHPLRGERHPGHKLTDAQGCKIRARRAAGERVMDLAAEYGVSRETLRRVINRQGRWAR